MGQAKQRGTFEQRKSEAISREISHVSVNADQNFSDEINFKGDVSVVTFDDKFRERGIKREHLGDGIFSYRGIDGSALHPMEVVKARREILGYRI